LEKTQKPVFVSRALQAVAELAKELPDERIEEATTAPNDYLVLLNVMNTPSVVAQLTEKDPLASAKLRGVEAQQKLLQAGGGVLSAEETAELLGISRQAVDKRRKQGQLIGLVQGRRGYAYPAWQFEDGRTIEDLEQVLKTLQGHDPWMQMAFFLNGNERLGGRSPLEVLRAGDSSRVLAAAAEYGEQGAA
jgi:biotin operon repressor